MPVVKILKDGKEITSIIIPDDYEIRIVHSERGQPPEVQQPVLQQSTELTVSMPPTPPTPPPAPPAPKPAEPSEADIMKDVRKEESKEVNEIMKSAIAKVEETSKKLVDTVEKEKEKKEDISLIRKVIEDLVG